MKWCCTFLMLLLAVPGAAAQESTDYPQLVARLHPQFGVVAEAKDIEKGWVFIRLYVPSFDTVKYNTSDRKSWAHGVARFARTHSSVGGHAQSIEVQLLMIVQSSPTVRTRRMGFWNWDVGQLDADSARPPDILKGARPSSTIPFQ